MRIEERGTSYVEGVSSVSGFIISFLPAVPTHDSKETIDNLNGTEDEFQDSQPQEYGEEDDVPKDDVRGLDAEVPRGFVKKIIVFHLLEVVTPICCLAGLIVEVTQWSIIQSCPRDRQAVEAPQTTKD